MLVPSLDKWEGLQQEGYPVTGHQGSLVDMLLGCKEEVESSGEEGEK